ncbi:hypothetical protein [Amycolatopsis sp. CA-230715]|uniref:hypothetical protein n=1 Tax=Amycolatopsis sp. CA-230715 TaxID=2745196 RepID=UPI001C328E03|nr:hypothetical protein [Amycolatopsis sp. CA-230715]QWF79301.1 hypothetical protein HUW46_02708 [Amycolatopsis sp. CA-230715]
MIPQVDDALCRLLGPHLPPGTVVRVDPPKPTWQSDAPSRVVNLFLFGLTGTPAPGCRLSYLVTAKAPKVRDEHVLLDAALLAVARPDSLPGELRPPVALAVGDVEPGLLWTTLGMPARAAFVAVVDVPHSWDSTIAPTADSALPKNSSH